jgi:site-specific DNA recombinase
MTKRAVTYARVSYDDRGTDGRNLDSQLDMCRTKCGQRGYTIAREIHEDDRGASGADSDLPGIVAIMDMARAHQFDVLVVRELDRLARDYIKAEITQRDLKKLGIEIDYVLYDIPPGHMGDMFRRQLASFAEFVRQDTIAKTARGRRNSVQSGNINVAARPPYGYAVEEDKLGDKLLCRRLVPFEPEAVIVRSIFDWYTRGDGDGTPLAMNAITRRLCEMQVPTAAERNPLKGRNKKRDTYGWNRTVVQRILKTETYIGHWAYGKRSIEKCEDPACDKHRPGTPASRRVHSVKRPAEQHIPVAVPALVDRETWDMAQQQLGLNRRNVYRLSTGQYLMRTRLTCGMCGAACICETSVARGRPFAYYSCAAQRHKLSYARNCSSRRYRSDWVDAKVWEWVSGLLKDPAKLEKALREVEAEAEAENEPNQRRMATVKELLAENEQEHGRLMDLYLKKVYTLEEVAGKKADLEGKIARFTSERDTLDARIGARRRSSEQVRRVLAFAKLLGPNVDKATSSFQVRVGLMSDLDVSATLAWEDGVPVVYARCVIEEKALCQDAITTSGNSRAAQPIILTERLSLAEFLFAKAGKRANVVVE